MSKYGLSGYLAPDGEWYPCEYQEHSDKAVELVGKYKLSETDYNSIATEGEFIKFGTAPWTNKEGCGECHVFLDKFKQPTKPQIQWLSENLNKATERQKNEVLLTFSAFYKMNLQLV